MRKYILVVSILFSFLFAPGTDYGQQHQSKKHVAPVKQEMVYLCNSSGAYAYHSTTSCRGLNRCNHGIIKVSKTEAIDTYHRSPCKICE